MPDGNPIKEAVRALIRQEIAALIQNSGGQPPLQGIVSAVNADGTLSVSSAAGDLQNVGTPIVRTVGEQVIVVTSQEGTQVAL